MDIPEFTVAVHTFESGGMVIRHYRNGKWWVHNPGKADDIGNLQDSDYIASESVLVFPDGTVRTPSRY